MFLIYAIAVSSVAYYFLQNMDDKKADRMGKPRSSVGSKVMLWFFLTLVCSVLFYFLGNGLPNVFAKGGTSSGPSADVEMERPALENMLQRIPEEMQTGLPPFKSLSLGG